MGRILVTGASGGIGIEVCRELLSRGYSVEAVGRSAQSLTRLIEDAEIARARPGLLSTHTVDCTMPGLLENLVERLVADGKPLDGMVNCVGSLLLKPAHLTSLEEFESTFRTNVFSAFNALRAAGKYMQGGSIVLLSSCAASIGLANHEAIGAAKAAVEGLARSAAATYAPRKLRINCVAPGLTKTPLTKKILASQQAEVASIALHPLGRLGEPSDIARAVVFLLSDDSSWITGQTIGVDGGLSKVKLRT